MIDPLHDCAWTRGRRTNLRFTQDMFASAGAPPRVLLPALLEPDLVWYSTIIEYDIRMVALPEVEAARFPAERYADDGPIARHIKDLYSISEYMLTETVANKLGLVGFQPDPARPTLKARYFASFHDECFSFIYPVTQPLLTRLVAQVLQLHNFYLQGSFQWSMVSEEIAALLQAHNEVELRTEKRREHPRVKVSVIKHPRAEKIWPGLGRREIGSIGFTDHRAALHLKSQKDGDPPGSVV